MDENRFWICVWGIIAAVVCTLIISITYYNQFEASLIAKAVTAGNDPIAVACAFNEKSPSICGMVVAKMK